MTKEFLIEKINSGLSLNQISKETGKGLTTVRYWVKKYQINIPNKPFKYVNKKNYGETRFCPKCEKECSTSEFYTRRDKSNSSSYCKQCTNYQTVIRQRNLKKQMIEYKGGKCERCGYDKYYGALEFHHIDPSKKDFSLSHLKRYTFNQIVIDELDKCMLLCSNCHREIHGEQLNPKYLHLDSNQE